MKTKTMLQWPLLPAMMFTLISYGCKKSAASAQDEQTVTITAKTAATGVSAAVQLTSGQLAELKAGVMLQALQTGDGGFTAAKGETGLTEAGISLGGGNCPPISQATLDYYQAQANECCCSFIVCLQGEGCLYYLIYFGPGNGCTGGGDM